MQLRKSCIFCRSCIANTIRYCDEAEVKCPYRDSEYTCESTLQEREIKAVSRSGKNPTGKCLNKNSSIRFVYSARRAGSLPATFSKIDRPSGEQCREQRVPLQNTRLSWLVHLRRRCEQFPLPCVQGK